jgi:hypothetical protein
MLTEIEEAKAAALREIRAGRPQRQPDGSYLCGFCGEHGGDRGWQMWHACDARSKRGIRVVPVKQIMKAR